VQETETALSCIDPASDDPEMWECNCFEEMQNKCGGMDANCFQCIFCENANVCSSWKTKMCTEAWRSANNCPAQSMLLEGSRSRLISPHNGSASRMLESSGSSRTMTSLMEGRRSEGGADRRLLNNRNTAIKDLDKTIMQKKCQR